jgi:hypothetical protein
MGQWESKERGFKQGFKELQGVRPLRIKIEKRSNKGWAFPPKHPTHLTPLSVYPVSFLNLQSPPVKPS